MFKPAAANIPDIVEAEKNKFKEENKSAKLSRDMKNKLLMRKLVISLAITFVFMLAEIIGGIVAGSIAVLADSAHMFSDILGLAISIISLRLAKRPANEKLSFGYHRAGVLGALVSIVVIWLITGVLFYFAVERAMDMSKIEIHGPVMFGTAVFGLVVNMVQLKILGHGHSHDHDHSHKKSKKKENKKIQGTQPKDSKDLENGHSDHKTCTHKHEEGEKHEHNHNHDDGHKHSEDHKHSDGHKHQEGHCHHEEQSNQHDHKHDHASNENLRAAFIHILGDFISSIGVVIASILIWIDEDLKIADPICTFVFSALIFWSTKQILVDCINVLMEATPKNVNRKQLTDQILEIGGVDDIHDLHIWALSEGNISLSMHLKTKEDPLKALDEATKVCKKHKIGHATIQVEKAKKDDEETRELIECHQDIH